MPSPAPLRTSAPIAGFDAARWRALDHMVVELPWQTLPDHVHRSSAGRPWRGLTVWHQIGPVGDLYVPPLGNHTILLRRGSPTRLLQRHGNAMAETHWHRGEAVVVPTDTPSFWRSTVQRDNIHIDLAPVWLHRAAGDEVSLDNCFGRADPVLAAFAEVLMSSLDSNASLHPGFGEHLAMGLAIHLIENYAVASGRPRAGSALSARQMRLLTDAVAAELHEPWPVKRLADVVSLSPFHFSRAFKASFGLPPHTWIRQQRMELAARLLRESTQPMADVAALTGHPSAAHFSHAFRRHWGMTPTRYRQLR